MSIPVTKSAANDLSEPLATNYGPSTLTAGTGTVIANAAAITAKFTRSTGDDAVGLILPSAGKVGDSYLVYNLHATSGLKIYPPVNGDINDGSANAAITMEGKTIAEFIRMDGTTWCGRFTANA